MAKQMTPQEVPDQLEDAQIIAQSESVEVESSEGEAAEVETAKAELAADEIDQGADDDQEGEAHHNDNGDTAEIKEAIKAEKFRESLRIAEALLFASSEPVEQSEIGRRLPDGIKAVDVLRQLQSDYEGRGINLVRVNNRWLFRTASDLGWLLSREASEQRKLSRAAIETLAIIAYHQPVTRAEIEDIRGVAISKGTLDVLLETSWVRLRGRRKAPGRPVTYGTTDTFLLHFGLEAISDLPGLDELKSAGMFDGRLPPGFGMPTPKDDLALSEDEDPLEDGEADLFDDLASQDMAEDQAEAGVEAGTEAEGEAHPQDKSQAA